MKKIARFSMFAIAAMAAFACSKETAVDEVVNPSIKNPLIINAYTDNDIAPDTKTSLSGVNVVWATTDAIAGYEGSTKHESTETAVSEGGKKATFTFSGVTVGTNLDYLIYPASAAGSEDGGYYNITLPTDQTATANSFANGSNIALAAGKVADDAVLFKNLGALIGIKINNDNIESVKISAAEGMTGDGLVDPSSYEAIENSGTKYVNLTGGLTSGTQYYAVVYPSPLAGYTGLEIQATNNLGQTATYTNDNPLVLNRNDNKQIANLTIADSKWSPSITSWSYTFGASQYTTPGSVSLNSKSWTLARTRDTGSDYFGYDSTKGQQFGKGDAPFSSMSMTADFSDRGVINVKVKASGAKDIVGSLSVTVDGTAFKTGGNTSVSLTKDATDYIFTSPDGKIRSGSVVITMTQTSSKALYVKTITVNDKPAPTLSWKKSGSETDSDTAEMVTGEDTMPTATLYNPAGLTITYGSSDEAVATINPSSGEITLVGGGSTTISATSTETAEFASATKNYTLTVTDSRTVCSTPTFSPVEGAVDENTIVTVSSTTTGSTIYYTIDGSVPSTSSSHGTVGDASVEVTIDEAKTIKAIAVKDDCVTSSVGIAAYTITGVGVKLSNPLDLSISAMTSAGFTANWTAVDNASSYDWVLSTATSAGEITGENTKGSGNVTTAGANITSLTLTTGTYYLYIKTKGNGTTYLHADGYSSAHAYMIAINFDSTDQRPKDFPTSSSSPGTTATGYTIDGYTFVFYAATAFYWNNSYLLYGKSGSYILTPAISGKTLKNITFKTSSGGSTNIVLNIKSADGTTDKYSNTSKLAQSTSYSWNVSSPAVNTSYRLQVTSTYNAQLTKLSLTYSF